MNKARRKIVVIVVGLVLLLTLGFTILFYIPGRLERQNCKQQLRSIGAVVNLYTQTHNGQIPASVDDLEKEIGGSLAAVLRCPGAQHHHLNNSASYIFIDWSNASNKPDSKSSKYPLIYDDSFENHSGRGINILMVDGTVEWHSDSTWLSEFAAQHKDVKIVIPQ